VLPPVSK